MKNISELYKKDIMATDGRVLGTLEGVAIKKDWTVSGLTVKINNDSIKDLGKRKPFLGSLRMDIGTKHIKVMGDNIMLNKSIKDLGELLTKYHENNDASHLLKMEIVGLIP